MPSDVCISRHRGNPESVAANLRAEPNKTEMQERIWAYVRFVGTATSKEIADAVSKPINCVSGRISELRAKGMLEATGTRRDGCAVLRAVEEHERIQPRLF